METYGHCCYHNNYLSADDDEDVRDFNDDFETHWCKYLDGYSFPSHGGICHCGKFLEEKLA